MRLIELCTCGAVYDPKCVLSLHREKAELERIEHKGIESALSRAAWVACQANGWTLRGWRIDRCPKTV